MAKPTLSIRIDEVVKRRLDLAAIRRRTSVSEAVAEAASIWSQLDDKTWERLKQVSEGLEAPLHIVISHLVNIAMADEAASMDVRGEIQLAPAFSTTTEQSEDGLPLVKFVKGEKVFEMRRELKRCELEKEERRAREEAQRFEPGEGDRE